MKIPDTPDELLIATEVARLDSIESINASWSNALVTAKRCLDLVRACAALGVSDTLARYLDLVGAFCDGLGDDLSRASIRHGDRTDDMRLPPPGVVADTAAVLARGYAELEGVLKQLSEALTSSGDGSPEVDDAVARLDDAIGAIYARAMADYRAFHIPD